MVFGVVAWPTQRPIRKGSSPHRSGASRRSTSHAQTSAGDQRINAFGVGGEIEIRSGLLFQKQIVTGAAVHVGLGTRTTVDVVRIVWPNGVMQAEFQEKRQWVSKPRFLEGLALVQAQAMACGCVVIGTPHTGAEDLLTDGQEGFVVPIRDGNALAQRLQQLADLPELRAEMGQRALARVRSIGGWRDYGAQALTIYAGIKA